MCLCHFSDSTAALSGDIVGRPIAPDAASEPSFLQIRSWLKQCCEEHPECGLPQLATSETQYRRYPSRLLNVGLPATTVDSSFCTLVDGPSAMGEYITLSYCWGQNQTLKTLKSNLAAHKQGIPLQDMPLTLLHAVIATRNLGVRYLWIDALCIVQDDLSEWEQEAPQMGLVYQNAFCTLAAAGSYSSSGGLFLPRARTEPEIRFQYSNRQRRGETVAFGAKSNAFYITPLRSTFRNLVQNSVWNKRGWVLQERNLSRRTILFGAGQTFFECRRHSVGEDGSNLSVYRYTGFITREFIYGHAWAWCSLVQDYTQRALTRPEDKLFAIEGLARDLAARTGESYCAGAWLEHLPLHVMWRCKEGSMIRPLFKNQQVHTPSWSWATLDGPVTWGSEAREARASCHMCVPDEARNEGTGKNWIEFSGPVLPVRHSERTLAVEGDEFGELHGVAVWSADIDEHASCYVLLLAANTEETETVESTAAGKKLGWAIFDEDKQEGEPSVADATGPLIAAVISKNAEDGADRPSFNVLILREVSDNGTTSEFVRVGMGEVVQADSVECSRMDLKIV